MRARPVFTLRRIGPSGRPGSGPCCFSRKARISRGAVEHRGRHAGQPGDVDAVALVGAAGDDPVQEDDLALALADRDVGVAQPGLGLLELDELVVVRGEEGAAADRVVQVLGDRPGERDAVEGAGAAADLVEDHQAARRRVVEDVRRLGHLDHERALAAAQLVAGADAGEDPVDDADPRLLRRDERCRSGPGS